MSNDYYKVGLNFIVGLSGTELLDEEAKLLAKLQPAGIILFRHNIDERSSSWPTRLISLIADARAIVGREGFFTSIDHEGGSVHRLPLPCSHFPAAQHWSDHESEVGLVMGKELRSLSINMNFAPVLDLFNNPENTVIGKRAFAAEPVRATESARRFVKALEAQGVIACGKHFPGHGGTVADSHVQLPVFDRSLAEMENVELYPFRALIQDGLQMLMTAHVLYPQLDPQHPATLSKSIIHDLLRAHLGFTGVVISDALEMGALKDIPDRTCGTIALQAGVDLLLVAKPESMNPAGEALRIADGLLEALDAGSITEPLLRESHKRIHQLFEHGKRIRQTSRGSDFSPALLGCDEHAAILAKVALRE